MSSSFFFLQVEPNNNNSKFIQELQTYSTDNKIQTYVVNKPLGDNKYSYAYEDALVVLVPNHKIMVLNFSNDIDGFLDFSEDFIEDLGSISDKYEYKDIIGRPRQWKSEIVYNQKNVKEISSISIDELLSVNEIRQANVQKKCELLISLLTGSINDIERIKEDVPDNILDKVKQKIVLFDGVQTRFVYDEPKSKVIRIQGLSGTGKTELLLHKLKEIYLREDDSRVLFTCHNKILASTLRKRIPDFFNFMKVEKQIKWQERLWCVHGWGTQNDYNSGSYRYICDKYGITFHRYSYAMSFEKACKLAIESIKKIDPELFSYAFDYVLIDESQDFPEAFVELCCMVTSQTVYVAGDIFQSIFDENIVSEINPDYLLSKCYRTDPRTLMFAHALGMGLFEDEKLRWLKDNEWKACGYDVEKPEGEQIVFLKREPLRRFEDLESGNVNSVDIIRTRSDVAPEETANNHTISIIKNIIKQNRTVTPDDIGIVFVGNQKKGFILADTLEYSIKSELGWDVNKAYESKTKIPGTVFISNKNNVKGLEFPFVICVTDYLSDMAHERNALYMMLTRSFIKTYLLIDDAFEHSRITLIEKGLEFINENGYMRVSKPTKEEESLIETVIDYDSDKKTLYEMSDVVFEELETPEKWRKPLFALLNNADIDNITYEKIKEIVALNSDLFGIEQ